MPVYDQSYRTYEGALRSRWRWAIIVGQEWRILFSRRIFIFLMLAGNFHFVLRIIQVFLMDIATSETTRGLIEELRDVQFDDPGAWVFLDFLRFQSPLIFITLIYAGAGLICNDFRNNLTEIYFSKPINWRDYVAGKVMSLVTIGLSLTAAPALLLTLIHVMFDPTKERVLAAFSYVLPIIAFSLLLVGSFTLVILASSSLVESAKFAGSIVFMLAFVNVILGIAIAGLMENQDYLVIAFPVSLNNLGEALFQEDRYQNPVHVPWPWSAAYVATVCGFALAFISQKARRAEIGR